MSCSLVTEAFNFLYFSVVFGSAICQVREAASHPDLLMSLNLSRNAVAMERAYLADAERALEDCSSCLVRDVIVSEVQAAEHNRSIVSARDALSALRRQIRSEHEFADTYKMHNCNFCNLNRLLLWLQDTWTTKTHRRVGSFDFGFQTDRL